MVDFPHTTSSVYRFVITVKFTDCSVYLSHSICQPVSFEEIENRVSSKDLWSKAKVGHRLRPRGWR